MGLEIERKFLVNHTEWYRLNKPAGVPISQGYIVSTPEKTIRIRLKGDEAFLTIKGKTEGATRSEYEFHIPFEDAAELLENFCESVISKTRYNITFKNKLWEVDEFHGENKGLILAEIELDSEYEAFELPDWVTKEVTSDERYYNAFLALHPFTEW